MRFFGISSIQRRLAFRSNKLCFFLCTILLQMENVQFNENQSTRMIYCKYFPLAMPLNPWSGQNGLKQSKRKANQKVRSTEILFLFLESSNGLFFWWAEVPNLKLNFICSNFVKSKQNLSCQTCLYFWKRSASFAISFERNMTAMPALRQLSWLTATPQIYIYIIYSRFIRSSFRARPFRIITEQMPQKGGHILIYLAVQCAAP